MRLRNVIVALIAFVLSQSALARTPADTEALITALGFRIAPDEARDIAEIGVKITKAANEQIGFIHPENPGWAHISFCQVTKPIAYENGVAVGVSAVAIEPGKIDRSPTGTGCSARMAVLHACGVLKAGDRYIGRSHLDCA